MMADCIHHNSQSLAFFIIQFSPMGYFCLLSDHIIFAVTFAAGLYVNCSSDRKRPVINMFFYYEVDFMLDTYICITNLTVFIFYKT